MIKKKQCTHPGCTFFCYSKNLCFFHFNQTKARKPLKKGNKSSLGAGKGFSKGKAQKGIKRSKTASNEAKIERRLKMKEFFLKIWNKRPHKSEVSSKWLGDEPLSIYFHHIYSKSKYKELEFVEENIVLLSGDEHAEVESNPYKFEEVNKRREFLKKALEMANYMQIKQDIGDFNKFQDEVIDKMLKDGTK